MEGTNVWYFTIPFAGSVTISLTHTGQGPSPAAPDSVDFYVFNDTGHAYGTGTIYAAELAPVTGSGYTLSSTFTLATAGTYGVVATACWRYPPTGTGAPSIFSSADYQITASY